VVVRSIWRTYDREVALACLAIWMYGLSYGAVAVADGFPLWVPAVASTLVIAGSSELLFVGVVAAGGSPIAAAAAGLLVNARHVPYGLALPDGILGRGWRRVVGTHLMNDESVVFALAGAGAEDKDGAARRYWECGLGALVAWPAGAVMGGLLAGVVHNTNAFGLDAVFPAVILALIFPQLRDKVTGRAAVAGACIALAAAPYTPAGVPVLLALAAVLLALPRAEASRAAPGAENLKDPACQALPCSSPASACWRPVRTRSAGPGRCCAPVQPSRPERPGCLRSPPWSCSSRSSPSRR
jgi:4-azaleucine resistance transporter AzlC